MRALVIGLAALLIFAGCAANPVTGRKEFVIVSEAQATQSSAVAYRESAGRLIAEAARLRPETAKWAWEVKVIDEPKTVNAFAMAGGKVAVYRGMWETLKATDEELAQVLGHEIGHAIAAHTRERISIAMGTGLATSVAGAVVASRKSRLSETEADAIGIELAARAGFEPVYRAAKRG